MRDRADYWLLMRNKKRLKKLFTSNYSTLAQMPTSVS